MGNPLTQRGFTRLLDDRLKKVFTDQYESLPQIRDKFFNVVKDKSAWLEYFDVGSVPDPAEFHGTVVYQDVAPGYHTKIEPIEYAGGIIIERRLLDTEKYGVIENRSKGLAKAANRKVNKIAHEPFRYMDSTAFQFMSNEEGVALCSNSHTTKASGVDTSSGFDNLSTLPFDANNLETLRLQGMQLRDDIGERFTPNFDTIVFPSSLAEAVYEVTQTPAGHDTVSMDKNWQYEQRWKRIELPMLDDWDTNNWAIIDSSAMKDWLIWHEGVPLEFDSTKDFDTFMRKYISYFVIGWGWINWRWIVGSVVS